ncbi:hypothetical protein AAZX31_10G259000 [Glycine max]|uniref:Uncharacterized protein n=1 Tax=Glycine soja TaxID=3848 RepID=A0A445ITP7_GLYSO|nr:hypothetical protein D0Y65_028292 [Glycine soja]
MVFTCSEKEVSMAMGPERSKPLHNFMLPCLKWGSQRHLRCTKHPSDSSTEDRRSPAPREFDSPPLTNADTRTRLTRPRFLFGDEGIDAVREKLMLDLKTEADKMKDAILGKEVSEYNNDDVEMNDAPPQPEEEAPPPVSGVRTWNLRTRRAPAAGGKGVRIDERRGGGGSPLRMKSPKLRGSPEKEERRAVKFSLMLAKKEIEEDFMRMVGHRPPRRPKKRPRNVQKQLDTLFPGQWLSEVCADSYKVPDDAETRKVCECYTLLFCEFCYLRFKKGFNFGFCFGFGFWQR